MGLGGALSGTTEVLQSALNPSEPPSTASNRAFPLGLKVLLIDRLIYVLLRQLCAGDAENVNQPGFSVEPVLGSGLGVVVANLFANP